MSSSDYASYDNPREFGGIETTNQGSQSFTNFNNGGEFHPSMFQKNPYNNPNVPRASNHSSRTNMFSGSGYSNKQNNRDCFDRGRCNENAHMMGKVSGIDPTPVMKEFFSPKNIKRIQKKIKREINRRTGGKFRMEVDQDEHKLIVKMRETFEYYSSNIPRGIVRQTKCLNKHLVDGLVPDMITNIRQYYGYIKDISNPINPIDRPINVNNAGRQTLPSVTTLWYNS